MWTDPEKWTCPHPDCHERTVTVIGSGHDTAAAIAAVQTRHYKAHREAAIVDARLRKTDVRKPAPRWGQAS
jgi:hypothetical protein